MKNILLLALLTLFTLGCSDRSDQGSPLIERYKTTKPFSEVVEEVDFAITEKNFRITGRNTVGKGIRKRGYEDFPDIEVIHFCSLDLAKEVLDLDPAFVALMPCRITVHEDGDDVIVSLVLLPQNHKDSRVNDFARRMNATLREIVGFVMEENAQTMSEED